MKKRKRLVEEYAYPGFRPLLTVEKHPLDDGARVISLRRRQKKHYTFYDRKIKFARDLSCGDVRIYVSFEIRRVKCRGCGKVGQRNWTGFLIIHFIPNDSCIG